MSIFVRKIHFSKIQFSPVFDQKSWKSWIFQDFMNRLQNALKNRIFVQNGSKNFWREKNIYVFEQRRGILCSAISGREIYPICLFPAQIGGNSVQSACFAMKPLKGYIPWPEIMEHRIPRRFWNTKMFFSFQNFFESFWTKIRVFRAFGSLFINCWESTFWC